MDWAPSEELARALLRDRVRTLGSLFGSLAHHLSSPVGALLANISLAKEDLAAIRQRIVREADATPSSEIVRTWREIERALSVLESDFGDALELVERLRSAMRSMKVIAQVDGVHAATPLAEILDCAVQVVGPWLSRDLRVELAEPPRALVRGVPGLIFQTLLSLLSYILELTRHVDRAFESLPERTHLRIEAVVHEGSVAITFAWALGPSASLASGTSELGEGPPSDGQSSDVGLYAAMRLVEGLEGRIELHSLDRELGELVLWLPLADEKQAAFPIGVESKEQGHE